MFWEDFRVGETLEMGRHTFSEQEIIAFARQYDPQPFHLDPEAARASLFGGLVASGWHTCVVAMRLMCESYLNASSSLGSPGLDHLRFLRPVRPGDTLVFRRTVLAARPSASRPGVGLVKQRWEALGEDGGLVLSMEGWNLFGRRPAA